MKILQVFDFFSLQHGGGIVNLVYQISRALMQKGHEVSIYTSDFELDQDYINSLRGVNVYDFHCWSSLAGFYLMPGMIGETKRNLKDFDIIHLHCLRSFQNIVIYHYAKKYGVPYVLDTHGSIPVTEKRRLKWLFDVTFGNRILRDASGCIAETELGVGEYKDVNVNPDKIVLITPPFPVDDFSQLPQKGHFRSKYNIKEKHIIMFLGRINRIKGLDFLVESFFELTKDRKDIILVIVGPDDGYKSTLVGLIDKLNLSSKVLFTGFLGGEKKLSALVDADVVVQTSRYEHGTGVPFEAILCNTPIIVSKGTGSSENVSRVEAGYLVEFGNKKELKDTMQNILNNPAEAMFKTQTAKEYIINNLSMEKNVEKYEMMYMDCILRRENHKLGSRIT